MEWNRREFLKIAGATTAVTAFGGLGFDLRPAEAQAQAAKLKFTKQTTSVCCYCSVGCGLIASTDKDGKGRVVNIEGDPDHPISEGALCPKGASHYQLGNNDRRVQKVLYRAPYSENWEEKSWDFALDRIARKVKEARDASFTVKDAKGRTVNRCEGIASVGSAAMDNEECWIYQAMLRAMGLAYIEHQARI
jgi:formate dehydrogenase major subunit